MSLDVDLIAPAKEVSCICEHCNNQHSATFKEIVYSDNITHNLTEMADKAGLYEALWGPDEINVSTASELIPHLQAGLDKLKEAPAYYKQFNSPNGWGMYEHFVPFVENYLAACIENPDAIIEVSV